MSYDLDSLHQKYGLQLASVQFATVSDASGLILIATTTDSVNIIHQVTMAGSVWVRLQLGTVASSANPYWEGTAGQTFLVEQTRIQTAAGLPVFADLVSINASIGNGFFHVYFTQQKGGGVTIGSL